MTKAYTDQLRHFLLSKHANWHRETFTIFGRSVAAPRSLCWFGDVGLNYRYTGIDHVAQGWPHLLDKLRTQVNQLVAAQGISDWESNFLLANKYIDGNQHMGWHADNEQGAHPLIVSVSIGARRRFLLEEKNEKVAIDLADRSALMFNGQHRHCLPKTKKLLGDNAQTRINLTFRNIKS